MLDREQILAVAAGPRPTEEVEVEGLGVVRVRVLSAAELASAVRASAEHERAGREGHSLAAFAAAVLSDGRGRPLFGEADVEALAGLPHHALREVEARGIALNRLRRADHDDAKKN